MAQPAEGVDGVLLHGRVDRLGAELRTLEEVRKLEEQTACRRIAVAEQARHEVEVLERRLGLAARRPARGQGLLHARVGGDHGPPGVRLGTQVVEGTLGPKKEKWQSEPRQFKTGPLVPPGDGPRRGGMRYKY